MAEKIDNDRFRAMLESARDLARKLARPEQEHGAQCTVVFDAIRALMTPPNPSNKKRLGFIQD